MFSFGRPDARQFGGVGVMIDTPRTQLVLCDSDRLEARGPLADRTYQFACRAAEAWSLDEAPRCRIEVLSAPRAHVGLGLGTQLGLSVAAGLNALLGHHETDPTVLARWVGRGLRSAVGTHGFARGGMIVEAGKTDPTAIGALVARVELPSAWRFVLICPHADEGLSGAAETQAFANLPPVPAETSETLWHLAQEHLAPAARNGQFGRFSESLYQYGHLAGSCFATKQGGPFASPRLARLVETIRALGIRGVGQSSWGPTLFALLPDEAAAVDFVDQFRRRPDAADQELSIAAPNRCGAQIEVSEGRSR
jgi:beta-RFAP synthase